MISIYPRYSRPNRRYKIKVPKEKFPIEKKLMRQSAASFILFAVLVTMSFLSGPQYISDSLDTSYTAAMWKKTALSLAGRVTSASSRAADSYFGLVSSVTKQLGIEEKSSTEPAYAKAEEKKAPPKDPPPEEKAEETAWHVPVKGEITSEYGSRIHPIGNDEALHTGIDIGAPEGESIVSTSQGRVKKIGADEANGNYIVIEHANGFTSVYAHLRTICVAVGDEVSPTIKIGEVGSTGISTGPHLHFELKLNGESINPRDYVNFENQQER